MGTDSKQPTHVGHRLWVIGACLAVASACGGGGGKEVRRGADMAVLGVEPAGPGMEIERFDLNGDGKPDVWKVYRVTEEDDSKQRVLVRKDMDLNWDGRLDLRQHLDESGRVVKEEMDLDFDGHVDAVAYYEEGQLVRKEMDLTFDGRPDVFRYYEGGKLVRKERVVGNRGRVGIWEYYRNGHLTRVARDLDGDGKPDQFEDVPVEGKTPEASPPTQEKPAASPPGDKKGPPAKDAEGGDRDG